ncbi:hypothetical protein SDC9_134616 [bioreactor metagenome]|uniref:Uncharacterized protein n=1 Tax=bioreactor metagenome TaxID=1076179 RepID=A0A645DE26_9ZZZZ
MDVGRDDGVVGAVENGFLQRRGRAKFAFGVGAPGDFALQRGVARLELMVHALQCCGLTQHLAADVAVAGLQQGNDQRAQQADYWSPPTQGLHGGAGQ